MSDIFTSTEPGSGEEEFESLFESFHEPEDATPVKSENSEDRLSALRGLFKSITGRKRLAGKHDTNTSPANRAATGEVMDLSSPLDLDSARMDMLSPEGAEPVTPQQLKKKSSSTASRRLRLSRVQLAILGILLVLVLAVYGGLVVVMLYSRAEWATPPVTEPVVTEPTPASELLTPTATPLEAEAEEHVEPTATVPPATATPQPSVATRLDLQVMRDPHNLDLRLDRGAEYLRLGDYAAALRDFEYAEDLDQERAEVHLGQGRAYIFLRRWQEAEAALGTAISFNSELEAAHFELGRLFYYEARYAESAQEFDWAAELNREEPLNEAWLARAAVQNDDLEEAQGALGRVFSMTEELPVAYLARAQVWILEEDYEAAQGDLLYAKSLAVHDFEILNSLARFYLEYMPERRGDAEFLAEQAKNWAQGDIETALALQTLGRLRMAQGRQEEAKQLFAQASDLATVDGQVGLPELAADIDALLGE
ncbi:MAG: hypothetical protein U9Q70_05555 [Chloroflexota bacterium]|nr:hypothetical protein [Chloroflexota bacterium]